MSPSVVSYLFPRTHGVRLHPRSRRRGNSPVTLLLFYAPVSPCRSVIVRWCNHSPPLCPRFEGGAAPAFPTKFRIPTYLLCLFYYYYLFFVPHRYLKRNDNQNLEVVKQKNKNSNVREKFTITSISTLLPNFYRVRTCFQVSFRKPFDISTLSTYLPTNPSSCR